MRKLTESELEVFKYLNDLRDSGETNMFGSPPYVQQEFGLSQKESRRIVSLWMQHFREDPGQYDELLVKSF